MNDPAKTCIDIYIKHVNSQQNSEILLEEQNAAEGPSAVSS